MNFLVIFWIAIAIFLGVIESLTFSLISIWGALAAVLCAVISTFGLSFTSSLCLFICITVILLLCTRPFVKRFLLKNNIPTNADRIIGASGVVTKTVTLDNPGEVKVMGQFWTAVSETNEEISEGTRVVIRSIDGVKVLVDIL